MASKISGFKYPDHGLKIFAEDFRGEQEAISDEIIERFKKVLGTGVIWGGAVSISATAGKVDVAEFFGFDPDGKMVYFPTQTGQVTLAEGTNTIVARHKFTDVEYERPFSGGQVSEFQENSFEIIARTSGAIAGDIPLRTVTMASGVRTLGSDLRTYASLQAKINRIDELGTNPAGAFPDIATRLLYLQNLRQVGEIFPMDRYIPPSASFPALPLSWSDRSLSEANWPDLIPIARSVKMVYMAGEGAEKSAFDITHYARASNVVTITLANTTAELALLAVIAEANLVHGSFSSWWALNLPVALGSGDVPAGDYAITGIDAGNRLITFSHSGSNVSTTGVSRTVEIYPHRIPGSTSTVRHYQAAGRTLVSINDANGEVFASAMRRDRFQKFAMKTERGSLGTGVTDPWANADANVVNYAGGTYTASPYINDLSVRARGFLADGAGTPRTGSTTDPRSLGVVYYKFAGRYLP